MLQSTQLFNYFYRMSDASIKQILFEKLMELFDQRLHSIRLQLDAAQEAANNETKSSAGDKYETERAMQQLNKEMFSKQLAAALQEKETAIQIQKNYKLGAVSAGALVITTAGNFYLLSGMGKLTVEGKDFYLVAPNAPVALELRGKKVGDEFSFQNKKQKIVSLL